MFVKLIASSATAALAMSPVPLPTSAQVSAGATTTKERTADEICERYLAPDVLEDLDSGQNIVVTGTRASRSNQNASSPVAVSEQAASRVAPPPPPPPPPPPSRAVRPASMPAPPVQPGPNTERYDGEPVSRIARVADQPVSTFSIDVDTGSYANVRRMLQEGRMPPSDAVRTEEMLNYFRYDYPRPASLDEPFTVSTDMAQTPWNDSTKMLRIGLAGYDLPREDAPTANLVFLVDTSGSMRAMDKLPLVQCALALTAERLRPQDRVSIVTYAGTTRVALQPTSDKAKVIEAIDGLLAGGSTAGGAAIELAYKTARENFREGQVNRIMLATDGDFNVGVTDRDALVDMVEREREAGVSLTALGFGTGNYNEAMMEQIANHGNGNYFYIDGPMEAAKVLDDELTATLFTIAKDVKIQIEFNPAHIAEYRLIGYENRALEEEDFDNDQVDAGEIGAGHQVTALYELVPTGAKGWTPERRYPANQRPQATGSLNGEMAVVRLRYKLPDGDQSMLIERVIPVAALRSAGAASGDMAFALAVASYGQKLRGDRYLGSWNFSDSAALAGKADKNDTWRDGFLALTKRASDLQPRAKGSQ